MDISRLTKLTVTIAAVLGPMAPSWPATADEPRPTATPKAGTLAAYASATSLDRSSFAGGEVTPIVITGDNLSELGEGGVFTEVTTPAAELVRVELPASADAKTRDRWRKKVLAQRAVIERLEDRRTAVESEIRRIERGRLDSRALDRIEKAEARLRTIDAQIRRAMFELSSIVREARKDGAQPGWFR